MKFRTLTFNMQNAQPWDDAAPDDPRVDLQGALEFLRSQDADILFLQEVERGHDGGYQEQPPAHFEAIKAAFPSYHAVFGYPVVNPLEIPFGLGLAILSRFPLCDRRAIDLPAADIRFEFGGIERRPSQRLLLMATADIGGHAVRLMNTHLQAFFMIGATSADFPQQSDILVRELCAEGSPTLLAGDFNCAPGEPLLAKIESCGYRSVQNSEITWRRRPYVIDHIFFREADFTLRDAIVVPTLTSDHHAVRADFTLRDLA